MLSPLRSILSFYGPFNAVVSMFAITTLIKEGAQGRNIVHAPSRLSHGVSIGRLKAVLALIKHVEVDLRVSQHLLYHV